MPGIRSQTNKIPPPEEAPRRRRSSATDGNRKKNQPRRLSAPRRRRSTGELSGSSGLRVKSQFESLQRRGLSVVDTDRDKHVAFSFLEVREFPIILGGKSLSVILKHDLLAFSLTFNSSSQITHAVWKDPQLLLIGPTIHQLNSFSM
jgi:hypothetical protein